MWWWRVWLFSRSWFKHAPSLICGTNIGKVELQDDLPSVNTYNQQINILELEGQATILMEIWSIQYWGKWLDMVKVKFTHSTEQTMEMQPMLPSSPASALETAFGCDWVSIVGTNMGRISKNSVTFCTHSFPLWQLEWERVCPEIYRALGCFATGCTLIKN